MIDALNAAMKMGHRYRSRKERVRGEHLETLVGALLVVGGRRGDGIIVGHLEDCRDPYNHRCHYAEAVSRAVATSQNVGFFKAALESKNTKVRSYIIRSSPGPRHLPNPALVQAALTDEEVELRREVAIHHILTK